jgi:hypothetical protein
LHYLCAQATFLQCESIDFPTLGVDSQSERLLTEAMHFDSDRDSVHYATFPGIVFPSAQEAFLRVSSNLSDLAPAPNSQSFHLLRVSKTLSQAWD